MRRVGLILLGRRKPLIQSRCCGIFHQNKVWPKPAESDRLSGSAGFRIKFIFADPAETLVQRGFRKSGLRKIRFSKNLDIKILRTNILAGQVSRWANRHCLDHDRAIWIAGARSDVTAGLWKCLGGNWSQGN
jgi:hypothetical protein